MAEEKTKLRGIVENVSFRNEINGFTVMELECDGLLCTVVGVLPEIFAGEELIVIGTWQSHAAFGEQLRLESYERYLPAGASAILRYLSSGAVKGVGPATASRIVEMFGDATLEVIEKQPERLAAVKGISKARAEQISEDFTAQMGIRETMLELSRYGITAEEALRVWKKWGVASVDMIKSAPYILCSPELGIGFDRADAIARRLDHPPDDEYRITAGVMHILNHNLGNGHTCLPEDKLAAVAADLLEVSEEDVLSQIEECISDRDLYSDTFNGRRFIFLGRYYEAETYAAGRLTLLAKYPPPPIENFIYQVRLIEAISGVKYNDQQLLAIEAAMERGAIVLTGGPGTGKTTTLNAIIETLEAAGQEVAIAAPTGRAAKRITEITGREAKTIHRLLEVEWTEDDKPHFRRDERNPLDCDALVVDELSMTDILLFESLLRALRHSCRLILVGDSDQLPSVGAGNVLADLISSGCLPVVHLTEVFRQAQMSAIVTNAHKIVGGEMPDLSLKDNDFFFLPAENEQAASNLIADLCYRRLPEAYGFSPLRDIQVLCPSKIGECGTRELNRRLQQRFNPQHHSRGEITINTTVFRVGDKVMQIKNNYDVEWSRDDGSDGTGIFNGDVGILEHIDRVEGILKVRFDDRTALYSLESAEELEHAYAITVHKSQGSEFEAVIIPVMPGTPKLFYRNLLYTAVTRARKILILVGKRAVVETMVKNKRKGARYSGLSHFLVDEMNQSQEEEE